MDSGSTHSFVSHYFARNMNIPLELLNFDLSVAIPLGKPLMGLSVYKNCEVKINDQLLIVDLVLLAIHHFDVLLGIDWLSINHAIIYCEHKRVIFQSPTRAAFSF